jgi:hypothetical protein
VPSHRNNHNPQLVFMLQKFSPELIIRIATKLPPEDAHPRGSPKLQLSCNNPKSLSCLAAVSRTFRAILLPILFKQVAFDTNHATLCRPDVDRAQRMLSESLEPGNHARSAPLPLFRLGLSFLIFSILQAPQTQLGDNAQKPSTGS